MATHSLNLTLTPDNARRLSSLCGRLDEHIRRIESGLALKISRRGNAFRLSGGRTAVADGGALLKSLYLATEQDGPLSPDQVHLAMKELRQPDEDGGAADEAAPLVRTPRRSVKPRGRRQRQYVDSIRRLDINFGIGPAGTGKTYLAVACAVEALERNLVSRILLVRPAVEAGEKLGFLPGDLAQKVDPYLRPLYDALYEMLGFEKVGRLIERNIIEVAPLAYMRGRTLNNSFIILDESQNATDAQMKMFLTRIGFDSTVVVTGDVTQIDLPRGVRSGLVHAGRVLRGIDAIGFTRFTAKDVIRHSLVQRIVEAYDEHDLRAGSAGDGREGTPPDGRDG